MRHYSGAPGSLDLGENCNLMKAYLIAVDTVIAASNYLQHN